MAKNRESRCLSFNDWEVREESGEPTKLVGYASVFNQETIIFEGTPFAFRERFMPGSFKKTISESDIISSWNHNFDMILGRMKNKTLHLSEDEHGLRAVIYPPDTQAGRDAITSVRRGDVSGMSIVFQAVKVEVALPQTREDLPLRTIKEAKLFELGPVALPAYPTTSISARDDGYLPDESDVLENANLLIKRAQLLGIDLTNEQRKILSAAVELYQPYLLEPEHEDHHSSDPIEPEPAHSVKTEPVDERHYSVEERERRLLELSKSIYPSK